MTNYTTMNIFIDKSSEELTKYCFEKFNSKLKYNRMRFCFERKVTDEEKDYLIENGFKYSYVDENDFYYGRIFDLDKDLIHKLDSLKKLNLFYLASFGVETNLNFNLGFGIYDGMLEIEEASTRFVPWVNDNFMRKKNKFEIISDLFPEAYLLEIHDEGSSDVRILKKQKDDFILFSEKDRNKLYSIISDKFPLYSSKFIPDFNNRFESLINKIVRKEDAEIITINFNEEEKKIFKNIEIYDENYDFWEPSPWFLNEIKRRNPPF